jgi:predicted DNA-binding transcriptional regulator AlpA
MTDKTAKFRLHEVPATLAAVALIDATTCAAAGAMSVSWWHEQVRVGRAPAPVVRSPRCTRWTLSQVRAFWEAFAQQAQVDPKAGLAVTAQAKKASRAAHAKRVAASQAASGAK